MNGFATLRYLALPFQTAPLRLLAANRNGEALRIAKSRLQANGQFRPLASESLLRLAELARDAGDRPLARALLCDFERYYPDDPMAVRARRLAGELAR